MDREHGASDTRISTAVWRQAEPEALELSVIDQTATGFVLSGDVAVGDNNNATTIAYRVDVDQNWTTQAVVVDVRQGVKHVRHVELTANSAREWSIRRHGAEPWVRTPEFDGLLDIDLGCTPATNLLPIRRLDLSIGESALTSAVWIAFPDLEIQTLPQRYTRLATRQYRYESLLTGFTADLQVDDLGVVDRYGVIWSRVNAAPRTPP